MSATLLVLAAGLGSRFKGGIKQIMPVGPSGELLFEYSVFDGVKAGFDKIVFVIRRDIEKDFRELCADRLSAAADIRCVFQDIDDLPGGIACPSGRTKPWGTVHAVLAARNELTEPFVIVNADDHYGTNAFGSIYRYITDRSRKQSECCMGGFILKNTLSSSGTVTRGICSADSANRLTAVNETYRISRQADGRIIGERFGESIEVDGDSYVSMNMWGFSPNMIGLLSGRFEQFLRSLDAEKAMTAEYVLPTAVDELLKSGLISVDIIPSPDRWYGMTHAEDLAEVRTEFAEKVRRCEYPSPLFP